MAKKDLSELVGAFTSSKPQSATKEEKAPMETEFSPELLEAMKERRYRGAGIHRNDTRYKENVAEDMLPEGYRRSTYIVKKDTADKLKYISLHDTKTLKELVGEIFGNYVAGWERNNGEIKLK